MAINVNTVYTTVLSILNKEQRGYLTPDEFNKLATQVQLEIFEKFFEDYNQYIRMPKTDVEYASRMDHIYEEFQVFDETAPSSSTVTNTDGTISYLQPIENSTINTSPVHRLGSVHYSGTPGSPQIELMGKKEYYLQTKSPLLQPDLNFPIGVYALDRVTVFPNLTLPPADIKNAVTFNYIRKPKNVRWGFTVGNLGQYIYDNTSYSPSSLALGTTLSPSITVGTTGVGNTYNLTQAAVAAANTFQYNPIIANASGSGAEISILITPIGSTGITLTGTNTIITITKVGDNYNVGDQFVIAPASIGANKSFSVTLTAANLMNTTGQGSLQFEISESQQTSVVLNILKYAGIIINDTTIVQAASGLGTQIDQNTKK